MNVTIKIASIELTFNSDNGAKRGIELHGPFGSLSEMFAAMAAGAQQSEDETGSTGGSEEGAQTGPETSTADTAQGQDDGTPDPVADAAAEVVPGADELTQAVPTPEPTISTQAVLSFLTASEKFTMRTEKALFKHFGGASDELVGLLSTMANGDGTIATKKRRKDRAVLVYATAAGKAYLTSVAPVVAPVTETYAPAAEVAAEAKPELTVANLHAFLSSSDKYSKRTAAAIAKHFGVDVGAAEDLLSEAQEAEAITTARRRRDGVTLYGADASWSAPSPVEAGTDAAMGEEPDEVTTPELNVTNLRSFLNSDARFAKRTKRSIQKHFGIATDDHSANENLAAFLVSAKNDGDISTSQRRNDRVTLYSAA